MATKDEIIALSLHEEEIESLLRVNNDPDIAAGGHCLVDRMVAEELRFEVAQQKQIYDDMIVAQSIQAQQEREIQYLQFAQREQSRVEQPTIANVHTPPCRPQKSRRKSRRRRKR
jgi:hypothetical protein